MHLSGNHAVKRLTEDNSPKKCVQALLFGATAVALALVYLYIQNCFSSCRGRKVAKKKATRKMLTKHKGGKFLNRSANCGAAEGTQPQLVAVVVYGCGAAAGHCTQCTGSVSPLLPSPHCPLLLTGPTLVIYPDTSPVMVIRQGRVSEAS